MSTYGNRPMPVHTWAITLASASITVDVGGTSEVCAIADGTYYGWGTTAGYIAAAGTLAKAIGDALALHSLISIALARYVVADVEAVVFPGFKFSISTTGSPAYVRVTAVTGIDDARVGVISLPWQASGVGNSWSLYSQACTDGVWSGMSEVTNKVPARRWVAKQRRAAYSGATRTVVRAGARIMYRFTHEAVFGRWIDQLNASQAVYASQAGTSVLDTYGTLDRLCEAVSQGAGLRVWLDDVTMIAGSLDFADDLRTEDLVTMTSLGGRRHQVTLPYVVDP